MLTEEQRQTNKVNFINLLCKLNIDLTEIVAYLESVQYFDQPYTQKQLGGYKGGLCEHALQVYLELMQLANAYYPNKYSEQDIIIVALFKDIYKAELYEEYFRNVKNTHGEWEQVTDYKNKETRPAFGELGFSSYMVLKKFITGLSDEVIESIIYWSCGIESQNKPKDLYEILRNYKLVVLTHMADMAASNFN